MQWRQRSKEGSARTVAGAEVRELDETAARATCRAQVAQVRVCRARRAARRAARELLARALCQCLCAARARAVRDAARILNATRALRTLHAVARFCDRGEHRRSDLRGAVLRNLKTDQCNAMKCNVCGAYSEGSGRRGARE